jgi:hypothetical protein
MMFLPNLRSSSLFHIICGLLQPKTEAVTAWLSSLMAYMLSIDIAEHDVHDVLTNKQYCSLSHGTCVDNT